MAIIKETSMEIRIVENGTIFVHNITKILEDGELLGEKTRILNYTPDTIIANIPNVRVRRIANADWTPALIAAYNASKASQIP